MAIPTGLCSKGYHKRSHGWMARRGIFSTAKVRSHLKFMLCTRLAKKIFDSGCCAGGYTWSTRHLEVVPFRGPKYVKRGYSTNALWGVPSPNARLWEHLAPYHGDSSEYNALQVADEENAKHGISR